MNPFIDRELFLGTQHDLLDVILTKVSAGEKTIYYALNADCMLMYWKDESYRTIINKLENMVYVDGMGVIFAQRLLSLPTAKERIATTDLFPSLMEKMNDHTRDMKVFFLGSKDDTAEKVLTSFSKKYANVQFVGCHHGYFELETESHPVIAAINQTEADILFVGLGNPVQEKWVDIHQKELNVSAIITCGGLFDYYSNNVKRAPLFMQERGFEWLFRLSQEPQRLFGRYVFGNFHYVMRVLSLRMMNNSRKRID